MYVRSPCKANFMKHIGCFPRNFCATSFPSAPLQLPSRMETHFWYVIPDEVKSVSLLNQYSELLSASEKEIISSMFGDQLRKRALLARALVRTTIARYQINKLHPRSLKFRKNVHGKPELEWKMNDKMHLPPLHFNLSHSTSMIVCGVTMSVPIGVDVEEKQRKTKCNVLAFSRRYFSPLEVKILEAISDPDVQQQEFIKLWTLKEAYVKALGKGFSAMPFKTFTIRSKAATAKDLNYSESLISKSSEIIVESSDDTKILEDKWHFVLLELAGSHFAAICVGEDETSQGGERVPPPLQLKVWKTVPLVEDVPMCGADAVKVVGGFIEHFN